MAIATGTAIALAAGAGAAGSLYSASQNRRAASQSAQAVTSASDQNIAEQQRQFDLTRQDQQPFLQSGARRLAAQDQLLGLQPQAMQQMPQGFMGGEGGPRDFNFGGGNDVVGGQQQSNPLAGFRQSGFYQIDDDPRIREGTNAAFSAKGMGLDGSAQVAMGRALQSNLYGRLMDYNSTLGQGSAQGLGAAQGLGSLGANMASNNASNRNNAANAMASSFQQRAQANNQAAGGILGAAQWFGGQKGWF